MNGLIKHKKLGFTMIELTLVILVVGVIVALAAAKLPIAIEKEKSKAGQRVLLDLYASQNRYELDNGNYASAVSNLDIGFRGLIGFAASVANNASAVASVVRQNSNPYTLSISNAGQVSCDGNFCDYLSYSTSSTSSSSTGGDGGSGATSPAPLPPGGGRGGNQNSCSLYCEWGAVPGSNGCECLPNPVAPEPAEEPPIKKKGWFFR